MMPNCFLSARGLAALLLPVVVNAQTGSVATEKEFLTDMPVVLSVSRLSQRLDEAPGAVTVLDRETIRRSGARDLADLLRLVPGFQSTNSFETDAPQVSYHGGFSEYSNRIQVLVDGRSTYSPFLVGTIGFGLQSIALQDIDHVEVLRGSNSAAYGARAFLGVINIVTSDPIGLRTGQTSVSAGQNGVRDLFGSIGWGSELSAFRVSADRRSDDGLAGSNGRSGLTRFNARMDWREFPGHDLDVRIGAVDLVSGVGFAGRVDKALHDRTSRSNFVQIDWRYVMSPDEDVSLQFSHANESYADSFPLSLRPFGINGAVDVSASGRARNESLSFQHTRRTSNDLRWVWGIEWRKEQVQSAPLYGTDQPISTHFARLFGNIEWRLAPAFLLNAGAMAERSNITSDNFAPRVMLNWHVNDRETLRFGVSRAFRPPSSFEKAANVSYSFAGIPLQTLTLATGRVASEYVTATELGYLGAFPKWALEVDVRAFHEKILGFVRRQKYALPAGTSFLPSNPADYVNDEDFAIQGIEGQLKWRPWSGAEIVISQAFTDNESLDYGTSLSAPRLATSLSYFQKLPRGMELGVIYQDATIATLQGSSKQFPIARSDVRVSIPVKLGRHSSLALTVQNLSSPNRDFDPAFYFHRRAFLTLNIED